MALRRPKRQPLRRSYERSATSRHHSGGVDLRTSLHSAEGSPCPQPQPINECQVPPSATPPSLRSRAPRTGRSRSPPVLFLLWRSMKSDPREGIRFRAKTPEAACVGIGAHLYGFARLVHRRASRSSSVHLMDGRRRAGCAPTPARLCWAYPAPNRRPCLLPTPSAQALLKA